MNDGRAALGDDLANSRYPTVKAKTLEQWLAAQ